MDELAAASAAAASAARDPSRSEFTESDRSADMVALFNDLDKNFVSRLLFSGKVAHTRLWRLMLETLLKKRMTPWQHAVFFGRLCPRTRGVAGGLKGRALRVTGGLLSTSCDFVIKTCIHVCILGVF